MNGKAFTTLNPRSFIGMFFGIVAAKNDEKSVSLTDSDVQPFLEGEGNQNTGKTERYVISGFGNGISRG